MTNKKTFTVLFRRRRKGKTDYQKRLALIKSNKKRLVVRKSNRELIVSLMVFNQEGDQTIVFVTTRELSSFGWKGSHSNLPAGYLAGLLAGKKAILAGEKEAILDFGLNTTHHGSVLFAIAKGAIDAGLQIKVGEDAIPSEERIKGKHIAVWAEKLPSEQFQKQFSSVLKRGFDPKKIVETFEKTKEAILNAPESK